jgi:hypothetical protein
MNLSRLRDDLDHRDMLGVKPMELYWRWNDAPRCELTVPMCRACILAEDPRARFEGDPEQRTGWWRKVLDVFLGLLVGFERAREYDRVWPCGDGGARICQSELAGVCLSRVPVGTCNED